ncbi:collagen-binding protein [Bacteroides fragilis]|nr:collagen-binding protein [Bacteroides fragilis]
MEIDAVTGIDFLLNEAITLVPSTSIAEREMGIAIAERGKLTKEKNTTTNMSSNIRITYNKTFAGRHDLTTGGHMDYYLTQTENISVSGYGVGTQMSLNATTPSNN